MGTYFKIAWRNLFRNPRRTLVIILAIGLGIWGVLMAMAMDNAFAYQMIDNFIFTYLGHLEVHARGYQKHPSLKLCMVKADTILEKIQGTPHLRAYAPRIKNFGLAQSARASRGVMLVGIGPEAEARVTRIREFVSEGRYFADADEEGVLIGQSLANELKIGLGDKVTFLTQGHASEEGLIESLRIIGLYRSGISELDKTLVYLPLPVFARMLNMEGKLSEIAIRVDQDQNLPLLKSELRQRLAGVKPDLKAEPLTLRGVESGPVTALQVRERRSPELLADPDPLAESFRLNPEVSSESLRLALTLPVRHRVSDRETREATLELWGVDPIREDKTTHLFSRVEVPATSWLAGTELEKELDIQTDWIVLSGPAGQALAAKPGDTLEVGTGAIPLRLKVVGTISSGIPGAAAGSFAILHREPMWQTVFGQPRASEILVRLKPEADGQQVSQELLDGLGLEILDWGELYPVLKEMGSMIDVANYVFLLVVYIAVTFGIANTMIMAVFERVRELGILKALGTTPGQIFLLVILESVFLSILGMILGMAVSGATYWLWARHGLDLSFFASGMEAMGLGTVLYPVLTAENIVITVLAALVIALGSALYPGWRASRLLVVEAMRAT